MLMTAELLLHHQRCKRKTFLDTHGDLRARDVPSDLLLKLQQDKTAHQKNVLAQQSYHQPDYPKGNWDDGAKATIRLMQQGVGCIRKGVLLAHIEPTGEIGSSSTPSSVMLVSRPDLLIKQPGQSCFGDWIYVPAQIELGKRPKLEYQIVAAYNVQVLAHVQIAEPETAWLLLRRKQAYAVNLSKSMPQMQRVLEECIQTIRSPQAPDLFIARQRCSLCRWYSYCYAIAKSQQHLSLLPGVTPSRYAQLQALDLTSVESLANASPAELEPVFGYKIGQQLVLQAQSVVEKRPILCAVPLLPLPPPSLPPSPIELYFDIEAEPDLNLDYLLGVLVIDRETKTEKFHSLLAKQSEDEELIWQQFLDLVWQYPLAPIFHFCSYEVDTVKRLANLYHTPQERIRPLLKRFVDVYEQVTQTVVLPVESYALKSIARWLSFEWRDPQANGSQCIYWYNQWLETGDRTFLNTIQLYNEDDCRATRHVKDWLVNFTGYRRESPSLAME